MILVLVQLGFYGAMIASATQVHRNLDADLIMIPAGFEYLGSVHDYRGRDAGYPAPPAQIRAGPIRALGSYLGCLTAKRAEGQG